MIDPLWPIMPPLTEPKVFPQSRAQLRFLSLGWALQAAVASGLAALLVRPLAEWVEGSPTLFAEITLLAPALEPALRAGGCGFFYGLLAFHLQRVDPDDDHLQAGLVGAVCAIRSLAAPAPWCGGLAAGPLEAMMEALRTWLPLWLPVVAAALWLWVAQRLLPAPRP